jgi:hypothetical protein
MMKAVADSVGIVTVVAFVASILPCDFVLADMDFSS